MPSVDCNISPARVLSALLLAGISAPASDARPMAALQVGRLTLHRCETRAPWCGSLSRRLDPGGAVPGSISVYFEYYPHTGGGAAAGTLVATEGGPGYPATGSRTEYLALFAPLRTNHDVLIMDNRGTGRSGALDCEPLQTAAVLTEANVGVCGRSLGRAAPLYSTALATDDLAAIVEALSLGRIDLYGDSYGSYFAQVFALRHPQQLRSLVLDGAYPLDDPDYPWYPNYSPAMRDKFNRACERAPACRAIGGSSLEHIAPALELLRAGPFSAEVRLWPRAIHALHRRCERVGDRHVRRRAGPCECARAGCGGARFQLALAGNAAGEDQLRAVSAALLTSADVIARAEENGAGAGVGLRGGTFTVREAPHGYRLSLREVRWTEDAAVSGRIDWPRRSGVVHADLELWTSQGLRGALQLQWPEGVNGARATVHGRLGSDIVVAEAPAP